MTTSTDGAILQAILQHLESLPHVIQSVADLAHSFGIRPRSLDDFINICCPFGVCMRRGQASLEWIGRSRAMLIINSIREQAEAERLEKPLTAVFNDTLDFSFQRTAVTFIRPIN
jgi:hypothetical protein